MVIYAIKVQNKSNRITVKSAFLSLADFSGDSKPDIVSTHYEELWVDYGSITVCLNCLPGGVVETKPVNGEIVLYPNPTNGYLRISSDISLTGVEIAGIYNCSGMAIDESRYSGSGQYLDLKSMEPGLYINHYTSGDRSISRKVIINWKADRLFPSKSRRDERQ